MIKTTIAVDKALGLNGNWSSRIPVAKISHGTQEQLHVQVLTWVLTF